MRFAIISDIHSNLEALTRAFEIIESRGLREIVCLGDIVGYGANPNECVELVFNRSSIVLLGNHDLAALDLAEAEQFNQYARVAAHWTSARLLPLNRERLRRLLYTAVYSESFLVHSSPYEPEAWNYILSAFDARQAFRHFSERICFVGHSHVPGIFGEASADRKVTRDDRFIVNVGSVGQPRDGDPRLSFGIFDSDRWEYENVRVKYDVETAGRKIVDAGLPRVLGERILVGM